MRDPYLRVLAEDAVDGRSLRPHGQDAPPAARVGERGRAAKQRVKRRHLQLDEVLDDFEDVRAPAAALFAGENNKASAVRSN